MYIAKCEEDCDIGTAYLGISNMRRQDDLKTEYKVPITLDH